MKMKMMLILFLILSFFRVETVWSGVPDQWMWGNPQYHEHDGKNHVFYNHNWQNEGWLRGNTDLINKLGSEKVPEKLMIKVVFSIKDCKHEDWQAIAVVGMVRSQKRIRPFFVHCCVDQEYSERLDTIMMPNSSVAVLDSINEQLRGKYDFLGSAIAIDEAYPGAGMEDRRKFVLEFLEEKIGSALQSGEEPVVFSTVLSYNAEGTLELMASLKEKFGPKVRTGIGGQLVRISPETYAALPFIDQVGVGDAEAILEPLLIGKKSFINGYWQISPSQNYAPPSYDHYLGLGERLDEMGRFKFGPFSGFRQLAVESVRGCSWAHSVKRACEMCSLQSVTSSPIFRSFPEYFALENQLAEKFGINWIFDVSNQFIPVMGAERQEQWLRDFLEARKKHSGYDINKYVYLTSNSISERTAPLLREAGIRLPYIGFDGWNVSTRKALNKPQSDPRNVLRLLKENGMYARLGLVIGSGLSQNDLRELPEFAESIINEFKGTILTWGNFLEIILPGSRVWYELEEKALANNWKEVIGLYSFFYQNGYLTWPQQERMTELYIRLVQKTDYAEVVAARDRAIEIINPHTVSITFRTGGRLEKA